MVQLHCPTRQIMIQLCCEKHSQRRRALGQADREATEHEEKRQHKRGKSFLPSGNIHCSHANTPKSKVNIISTESRSVAVSSTLFIPLIAAVDGSGQDGKVLRHASCDY